MCDSARGDVEPKRGAQCPECDATMKPFALPHPLLLHWILNPGLAVNELVLGQRIPRSMYVCKSCDRPYAERSYVVCPSCGGVHKGMLWTRRNAFGHWFGYVCPTCDGVIPCLWNLTSLAVLLVTFPLWWLPVRRIRPRWLAIERRRIGTAVGKEPPLPTLESWLLLGIFGWGLPVWAIVTMVMVLLRKGGTRFQTFAVHALFLPAWLLGGALWGWIVSWLMGRPGARKVPEEPDDQGQSPG
ncbi:MAG: hypothetical protein ACYTKD_02095 [Planctomycetota bacterium]